MEHKNSLSIVIPAYNEAGRLPATLERVAQYLRYKSPFKTHEILVVDDGSSDNTAGIAQEAARKLNINVRVMRAQYNQGKGAALRRGIMAARGEFILCTDADLSTPIAELDKLLWPVRQEGFDAAIGSRRLATSLVIKKPLYRKALSFASNFFIRAMLNLPYRDTQCGFKLYRREAAVELFRGLRLPRFSFDFEVLSRAQAQGMRVAEVGVAWEHSGATTVRARDVIQSFIDVFRLRFGLANKAYGYGATAASPAAA